MLVLSCDIWLCNLTRPGLTLVAITNPKKEITSMLKDPVCGMDVDPKYATYKTEYKGQAYYFCSPGCKKAFDSEPEKYSMAIDHSQHHHH